MSRGVKLFGVGRSGRGQKQTDISCWDHVQLKQMLLSKPVTVLKHFARCQVECLSQLEVYRQICEEHPEAARQIETVAALMGIPIRLESAKPDDSVLGDVLGQDRGEV